MKDFPITLNDLINNFAYIGGTKKKNIKSKVKPRDLFIERYNPRKDIIDLINYVRRNSLYNKTELNSSMNQYLLGSRHGRYIYNLDATYITLKELFLHVQSLVKQPQSVFLVGTRPLVNPIGIPINNIIKYYISKSPYLTGHTGRWLGGKLTSNNDGVIPKLIVIYDFQFSSHVLHEARKLNIPVAAIITSKSNLHKFSNIQFPIPVNHLNIGIVLLVTYIIFYALSYSSDQSS